MRRKKLCIYDWDGTIQNTAPQGSLDMLLRTLFTKVDKVLLEVMLSTPDDEVDNIIVTTRSSLYTFMIRVKCFVETRSFSAFSALKIMTVNGNILYNKDVAIDRLVSDDASVEDKFKLIAHVKSMLAQYKLFYSKNVLYDEVVYIDSDMPWDETEVDDVDKRVTLVTSTISQAVEAAGAVTK